MIIFQCVCFAKNITAVFPIAGSEEYSTAKRLCRKDSLIKPVGKTCSLSHFCFGDSLMYLSYWNLCHNSFKHDMGLYMIPRTLFSSCVTSSYTTRKVFRGPPFGKHCFITPLLQINQPSFLTTTDTVCY